MKEFNPMFSCISNLIKQFKTCIARNCEIIFIFILLIVVIYSIYRRPVLALNYISELKWPVLILVVILLYKDVFTVFINNIYTLKVSAFGGQASLQTKLDSQAEEIKQEQGTSKSTTPNENDTKKELSECEEKLEFERIYNRLLPVQFKLLQFLLNSDKDYFTEILPWYESQKTSNSFLDKIDLGTLLKFLLAKKLIEEKNPTLLLFSQSIAITDKGKKFVTYINKQYNLQSGLFGLSSLFS